jgi:hypothetical protein
MHPSATEILGDCFLYGLAKPDGGTRSVGVGAALRRLAGRCMMKQRAADIARVLTITRPTPEMLVAAGFAPDTPCNAPLQLGVGVPRGGRATRSGLPGVRRTHAGCSRPLGRQGQRLQCNIPSVRLPRAPALPSGPRPVGAFLPLAPGPAVDPVRPVCRGSLAS